MPRQTHPYDPKHERREAAKRHREVLRSVEADLTHWTERLCENDRWLVVQLERELAILEQAPGDEGARRRIKKTLKKVSPAGFGHIARWLRSDGVLS